MSSFDEEYAALTTGVGFVGQSARTQIEVAGNDRAAFLHNFTTNDIRALQPGQGREAFVLNARGHVISHVFVFCTPHSLVLDTVPGQAETLVRHLDRYVIREDVAISDRSEDWGELLLAGAEAESVLAQLGGLPPAERLSHQVARLLGQPVWLRRSDDLTGGPAFSITGPAESIDALALTLGAEGSMQCGTEVLETRRIEAGFPLFGLDFTDKNLPQEINRDRQAISFTKGCYLGQETVARIDALGHVNKRLHSVRFAGGAVPPSGSELRLGAETVGNVTSAAFSPRAKAAIALAFIRRGHDAVGQRLESDFGEAEIVEPMRSGSGG